MQEQNDAMYSPFEKMPDPLGEPLRRVFRTNGGGMPDDGPTERMRELLDMIRAQDEAGQHSNDRSAGENAAQGARVSQGSHPHAAAHQRK